MKNIFKHYESPKAEVIEIEAQGAFCTSVMTAPGGTGTTNMGINSQFGWI